MKKKLLAVGVAASLGVISGAAFAAPEVTSTGIGHTNIIPYFSTQNGNATLLSITNTDQTNGKIVKVRFRGAEWSDDIFDFQVFLSPGDVFTGAVTSANGLSKFATADNSCTLPTKANLNGMSFVPVRLQNTATGTLEGYVEIITMADVPPTYTPTVGAGAGVAVANPLFTAIKHVNGVAPCTSTVATAKLENLVQDNFVLPLTEPGTTPTAPVVANPHVQYYYTAAPAGVGSLTSYATIINVPGSKAFSNVATAVTYGSAQKAYFRQADDTLTVGELAAATNDRIFFTIGANNGAAVPSYQYDMPDLSSPVESTAAAVVTPVTQRNNLTTKLVKSAVVAEFSTLDALNAATDIVLSQPTRRYYYNYTDVTATPATPAHATIEGKKFTIAGDAATAYAALNGATNRVALDNAPGSTSAAVFYDREENKAGSNIVISPTPPGGALSLKGEVSVIGINNGSGATGALGALLTINDLTATGSAGAIYEEGWALISTTAKTPAAIKLPVIGFSATNVYNGSVGSAGTNYGTTLPLRYIP